ncbi:MAG: dUTP diphosphatase [Actinomycetota bacterium]|nr:dUTP diphosphatase [Actinomycetota bacterium]
MDLLIEIQQLDPDLPVPKYAYHGDAGCDLYSAADIDLAPGQRALVPTGIAISIPEGYAGFVQPRSGLAAKHGIGIVNTPGLIDSKYRGEIKVILINTDSQEAFSIARGDKIAQLVIQPVVTADFRVVEALDATVRGDGGFGSSGRR